MPWHQFIYGNFVSHGELFIHICLKHGKTSLVIRQVDQKVLKSPPDPVERVIDIV